jgi:uncharacterized protein
METDWTTPGLGEQVLSDADVEQLDQLLEQWAVPQDGMSLEMLDGFLSALVVCPDLVKPSEYFPEIWNHQPAWPDEDTEMTAYRLVIALWNDIVGRLHVELPDDDADTDDEEAVAQIEAAMPLLALPDTDDDETSGFGALPDDFPLAAAWGVGFMRGVGMRPEHWDSWEREDEDIAESLSQIARLTVLDVEQALELGLDAEAVPNLQDRMEIAGSIPMFMQDFHQARLGEPSDTHVDEDLCPCGSGRPYKQCCGERARLN